MPFLAGSAANPLQEEMHKMKVVGGGKNLEYRKKVIPKETHPLLLASVTFHSCMLPVLYCLQP